MDLNALLAPVPLAIRSQGAHPLLSQCLRRNSCCFPRRPPRYRRWFPLRRYQASVSIPQFQSEELKARIRASSIPTFQQAIQRLQGYWASVGCTIMQCSNTEVGAGTMNPLTFLRVLGPEPWNVAYVEPSIRPDDSRYGDNPNRLQRHTQFQVILKPDPGNSQDLFIGSLSALGIDVNEHDIRFVEDNWESPVLGAWGLGWEVWMDGMEITQFTYFQQAGSLPLLPVSVEITYGLERILMLLQGVDHFKKIKYADGITYGELFLENEKEMSAYYMQHANIGHIQNHFENFEEEARALLSLGLAIPAYDQLLKTSHAFNILDSRGFIGVTERARYFGRMRSLARQCAQLWVKTRETLGHPLGICSGVNHVDHPKTIKAEVEKVGVDPREFVLEIGTEEMPPGDVIDASEQLKISIVQMLDKQRLAHGEVSAWGTPRRLVIRVQSLWLKQAENELEIRGPPLEKAFDQQGNPTKAAEGFCRKYSLSTDDMYKQLDGKTEYVYVRVKKSARFALEVLAEELPKIISNISFPKSMRWNSKFTFSRPIRWILALHGDNIVPFVFAGVISGRLSCGLRNSASAVFEVESAETHSNYLVKTGVVIDMEERKENIVRDSISLAEGVGGCIVMDDNLLNEVANLVEAPVPILGKFDESFLELPKDILIMVMQKHQRYFHLIDDSSNKLLPYFIAVANGVIDKVVVTKGNEAVLRARYEDAKFFFSLDIQKKFSEFRRELSGILFHEKLGTMLDKVSRIEKTVGKLSTALGLSRSFVPVLEEAAGLAMSDLATSVVTEFTSLAGIMGRHYALRDGYSQQVAESLFEITLPRFSGDALPKTEVGIVLAIADRLDSLVGLFGVGCQPSSTSDPFGLRRIAYGLVQVLVENNKNLDLKNALQLVAHVQPIKIEENILHDVHQFISRRLEQLLLDKGISSEIVRSVLSERSNSPCLAAKSAIEMEALAGGDLFLKVIEAYSRPTRIIRGKDIGTDVEVSEAAFESDEERALWSAYLAVESEIHPDVDIGVFLNISSQLSQPLEDFFEHVYVMADDERIRKNRLALLKKIADLPKGIADLSLLPGF
ncbi:LOW QUALITY PROTEIN: glycine--tRNA ligase, chloroplastic/mitochondrial 2 [Dioscorea cayenensis subsp. rotundata]|uniref:glycine--tRNA ligase n=1 Tax=Dioscorea cayennensis subsp. rotundata TaxID=55577 RepID=A0AB40C2Y3_DIOCR|nr:LOW QUALITY PROTEIN: glycine--tRNA ligase, chloroplastic/mitochondrial 2 [Dioscorea cayenensis subsp. rotundata]